ncbi:MAG: hypothetical protein R3C59_30335 [Planctomycetaceae bacterium]
MARYGYGYGDYGHSFREYVPVAKRRAQAASLAIKRAKKEGRQPEPVVIQGTRIAKTFWGKAWCEHLESFSDYSNRLPRGRTYARNGSVVDLTITTGRVRAIVGGSEVYDIDIQIDPLTSAVWKKIRSDCSASIDSLLDLLSGRFSDGVMERLTRRNGGMFPSPKEIHMQCSCPDWAGLCKHLAAVLYGVGSHLDTRPELLFLLRGVDHTELVSDAVAAENLEAAFSSGSERLANEDLGAMFGIELDTNPEPAQEKPSRKKRSPASAKAATKPKAAKNPPAKKKATPRKPVRKKTTRKAAPKKKAGPKSRKAK